MILDFTDYVTMRGSRSDITQTVKNNELWFSKRGWCNYCNSDEHVKIHQIFNYEFDLDDDHWETSEQVYECQICGWWEHSYEEFRRLQQRVLGGYRENELEINSSILKSFEIDSKDVPINALRSYSERNPEKLFRIHPTGLEKLVQSVFQDHFDCEALHVGRSYDEGIDLILLNGDEKIIVQVKRRESPNKTEEFKYVQQLLGATVGELSKSCIFITTANKFSSAAAKYAQKMIAREVVSRFDLIDFHSFVRIMEIEKRDHNSWQQVLKNKKEA